jgi:death on curing protein
MSQPIRFLSVENVLQIHADTIREEGGASGIRDLGMLESAVAMPQAQFGGVLLHPDLAAMAAAYLFHIANNHAFVDGNKRAASLAALVFLDLNGLAWEQLPAEQALEDATFAVARHEMSKEALIDWFRAALALSETI